MHRNAFTPLGAVGLEGNPINSGRRLRFGKSALAVVVCAGVLLSVSGIATPALAASAPAAPGRALINSDTVSGGMSSVEAVQAVAAGLSVDVVSGAAWDAMSATEFGAYQVLIIGDPTCRYLAPSVASNVATWAQVVMGTAGGRTIAGNRVAIGTDPLFHATYGGRADALALVKDGIDFASSQPGRTGLYFDATCGSSTPGAAAGILQKLSTGVGTWTENASPPCGGNVAKIASTSKFDSLTSAALEGWGCSVHETFPSFASDWSPLAVATDTASHPVCGIDSVTHAKACGEAYILIAGSDIVVTAPDLMLTPLTGTETGGGAHSITATVSRAGAPLAGQAVTFTISGVNASVIGSCTTASGCVTDADGKVTFTYADTNGAGADTVYATYKDPATGSSESASAAVVWAAVATPAPLPVPPVVTPVLTPVQLATQLNGAANFAVLADAATTLPYANIVGDVGADAALTVSYTTIVGTQHLSADAATGTALSDLSNAYGKLKALPSTEIAADLGGQTVYPGVWHSAAAIAATGTVTFDALGDPNAIFVVQSDAALNTTASTAMVLTNGAKSSNIYWVTTGAATLGASSVFDGNILSNAAVTVGASSVLNGHAYSVAAAVTLGAGCFITAGLTSAVGSKPSHMLT